jgi:hypothetical protein
LRKEEKLRSTGAPQKM